MIKNQIPKNDLFQQHKRRTGKTSRALQYAVDRSKEDKQVLIFSLGLNPSDIYIKNVTICNREIDFIKKLESGIWDVYIIDDGYILKNAKKVLKLCQKNNISNVVIGS